VIPALDAEGTIRACINSLAGVGEIIVVDGGSSDGTVETAIEAGAKVISSNRGRGLQLRAGADAARGEWLLFLHADTVLEPAWPAAAARHMRQQPLRAGYFRLRLRSSDWRARLVERAVAWRCRLFALPFGDQGLLIARSLYDRAGGFEPVPLMEDVLLARRLGRRHLVSIDATAATSADRWERDGWARRSLRNLLVLMLHAAGASPDRLARLYR
jgi:rSAM/selenodomain-associated transferase 2